MEAGTEKIQGRRRLTLLAAAALVLAQAMFFGVWIWREESDAGATIVVGTLPVDPRDLLRGQYFRLRYEFESPERFERRGLRAEGLLPGETVYIALSMDDRGRHVPEEFDNSLPRLRRSLAERYAPRDPFAGHAPQIAVIQGAVTSSGGGAAFDFGIDRFFVPEGTPEPGAGQTVEVKLRVRKNLTPRILSVLVDGEPWPERR